MAGGGAAASAAVRVNGSVNVKTNSPHLRNAFIYLVHELLLRGRRLAGLLRPVQVAAPAAESAGWLALVVP